MTMEDFDLDDEQAVLLGPHWLVHRPLVTVHMKDTEDDKGRSQMYDVDPKTGKQETVNVRDHLSQLPHGDGLWLQRVATHLSQSIACTLGTQEPAGIVGPGNEDPRSVLGARAACIQFTLQAAIRAVSAFSHAVEGATSAKATSEEWNNVKLYGNPRSKQLGKMSSDWDKAGEDYTAAVGSFEKPGTTGQLPAPPEKSLWANLNMIASNLRVLQRITRMNAASRLKLEMLVEGGTFEYEEDMKEMFTAITTYASTPASKSTKTSSVHADHLEDVKRSFRTEVELGHQAVVRLDFTAKTIPVVGSRVLIYNAPYDKRHLVGLMGTIKKMEEDSTKDAALTKYTIELDRALNGGDRKDAAGVSPIDEAGKDPIKYDKETGKLEVSGLLREHLTYGLDFIFTLNAPAEVKAAILKGIPGAEKWRIRIWPTSAMGELKDHIRFTLVFVGVPSAKLESLGEGKKTGFAKEGAILTPRQVIFHFKDKIKENLLWMTKSQVDKIIDDKADALSISLDNPLDATLVDGYVYAPDLPYGLTNSLKKKGGIFTGLAKVGTTFNRARNAYALNFLRAERQLGMLQAMRDEIRRLKYQDKAFDVSGKWAMVAQPWSYLDFGTGQLNAKLTSEVLRRLLCFFSNLGSKVVTGADTESDLERSDRSGTSTQTASGWRRLQTTKLSDLKEKRPGVDQKAMQTLGSVVDQAQAQKRQEANEKLGLSRTATTEEARQQSYTILGVSETATPDEIKQRYNLRVRLLSQRMKGKPEQQAEQDKLDAARDLATAYTEQQIRAAKEKGEEIVDLATIDQPKEPKDDSMNERIVQTVRTLAEELRTIVQIEGDTDRVNRQEAAFQTERITFRKLEKLLDATYPTYSVDFAAPSDGSAPSTPPAKFGGVNPFGGAKATRGASGVPKISGTGDATAHKDLVARLAHVIKATADQLT